TLRPHQRARPRPCRRRGDPAQPRGGARPGRHARRRVPHRHHPNPRLRGREGGRMSSEAIGAIVSSTAAATMNNDPHNTGTGTPHVPDRPATPGTTAQLLPVQTREFVRERRGFYTSLIVPLGLSCLFFGIAVLTPSPASGGGFDETVMAIVVFLTVSTAPL